MSAARAVSAIDAWCDKMAFYRHDGMLEMLVPATLREFKQRVDAAEHLQAAWLLALTIHGFCGGDPGHSNEAFICAHIHCAVDVGRSISSTLVLDGASAMWEHAGAAVAGTGVTTAPVTALEEVIGCVMKWRAGGLESGIDWVWLVDRGVHPTSGRRRAQVCGLRLKTGTGERGR